MPWLENAKRRGGTGQAPPAKKQLKQQQRWSQDPAERAAAAAKAAAKAAAEDAAASAKWPTRLVVVLATYSGTPTMATNRQRSHTWKVQHNPEKWWHNTTNHTFIVYQRQNASMPNYSPNYGFEGGVIVQFVLEHYHALPDVTIFLQDRPEQHNPHWMHWSMCLRPNVTYAPMTNARMARLFKANAQTNPGTDVDDAVVEQCWRNFLDAWGSSLLMPREQPFISYFQGSTFAASRQQLRNTRRSTWLRAHRMIAGGDGRCHTGQVQWEYLSTLKRPQTRAYDTPDAHGKHTSANAFEALQHHLIGGLGREDVFTYDYCGAFIPDCPHTPCKRVKSSEKYHWQMLGRVEHERRRLRHEYNKMLKSLRRVADASKGPKETMGLSNAERLFWNEFGPMLGSTTSAAVESPRGLMIG